MTDREKAIIMAYTGACMLQEDKFNIFHKYVEEVIGRPVYTHELGELQEKIKEASKEDFIKLCKKDTGKAGGMTLGEFVAAVNQAVSVDMELRNADNNEICRCYDDSSVIEVYDKCKVIDWWSVKNDGRVIVHIDDSEVMECIAKNAEAKQ